MRKVLILVVAVGIAGGIVALLYNLPIRKYHVTGTITRDGKPLEWKSEKIDLLVIYAPLDRERHPEIYKATETDPKTGKYTLPPIPAGKYLVSIQQMDPFPTQDLLKFTYSLKDSPLRQDVSKDGEINIDLPRDLPR
jgi:hypothetical protein